MTTDAWREFDEFVYEEAGEPPPDAESHDPGEPPKWRPGWMRRVTECDPPVADLAPRPTVAEAREDMAAAMLHHANGEIPGHMLLIRAVPGVGKTTAAVDLAERYHAERDKRVFYAGPRHDFYQDLLGMVSRPSWWYEWLPRQQGDSEKGKVETCRHVEHITAWMRRGYQGIRFCAMVCGWDYVSNVCPYHAQRKRREPIIFGMHEHCVLGNPLLSDCSLVIGDERPVDKFAHEWRIPKSWIVPEELEPGGFGDVARGLGKLADSGQKVWGRTLLDALGGAATVLDACGKFKASGDAELWEPTIRYAEEVEECDYGHLPPLRDLLEREATMAMAGSDYAWRVGIWNKSLNLLLRRPPSEDLVAGGRTIKPVLWLDATANAGLYRRCFQCQVEVHDASPRMVGRIHQVHGWGLNKSVVIESEGSGKGRTVTAKKAVGHIEELVRALTERYGYQDPGIISYKDLFAVTDAFKQFRTGHFYAARGTNHFEGVDALFVVGTPQPRVSDVERVAKMLEHERDSAFDATWATKEVPFRWVDADGRGRQIPAVGFWRDEALEAILWSVREAEVVQAAHRARPLHCDVDIWLINNLPTPLALDGFMSYSEALDVPKGADVWKWLKLESFVLDRNTVTLDELREYLKLSKPTAIKYLDLLEGRGWVRSATRTGGRGRPKRSARREKVD